jgi:fatty acid desaturase
MKERLFRSLLVIAKILAVLILIVLLIYAFGDFSYIIVPFIVAGAVLAYLLYDINKKKTPMKKVPDWDDFVEKHKVKGVRKAYHRDTRDRHSRDGRQKHMEARIRVKR